MNSNDLLDVIGEAKEKHVLDAVNTRNGVQPQKKRLSLNRAFLIAAVIALMLSMISGTSSFTPGIMEISCSTPSIFTLVAATPGRELRRTLRSELPSVVPYPLSRGSITNFP